MHFSWRCLPIICLFWLSLADEEAVETVETVELTEVEIYYTYGLDPPTLAEPRISSPGPSIDQTSDGCQCDFPQDQGLVPITPHMSNAGWAMSPDQQCSCGGWCPFACPAGFQAEQWDTSPNLHRMNGGMFCNAEGALDTPRPDAGMCRDLRGEVMLRNTGGSEAHACQTVVPGSESMLIPNRLPVNEPVQIAIPDSASFTFPGTVEPAGAHFYINGHGIPQETACSWGTVDDGPRGNWAPFVVGINRSRDGNWVYVSLSWNPVFLEYETPFRDERPKYGIKVVCTGGGCDRDNCEIDPNIHANNEMTGCADPGEGYAKGPAQTFCVTSVPTGGEAEVWVFEL